MSGKVTHISEITQPRTATKIVESLEIADQHDDYHVAILEAAKALVMDGRAAHKYETQYASGTTIWKFGDNSVSVRREGLQLVIEE